VRHGSQENNSLIKIVLTPLNLQQPQQRKTDCVSLPRS
jgi:hypothetical protein